MDSGAEVDSRSEILFATKDGYLVWSTNSKLLQLHLDGSAMGSLSARTGLVKAAEQVGGTKSGLFGYLDGKSSIQYIARWISETGMLEEVFSGLMYDIGELSASDWIDFSLLPSGKEMGNIFDFAVFGIERKQQGIILKSFSPASSKRP